MRQDHHPSCAYWACFVRDGWGILTLRFPFLISVFYFSSFKKKEKKYRVVGFLLLLFISPLRLHPYPYPYPFPPSGLRSATDCCGVLVVHLLACLLALRYVTYLLALSLGGPRSVGGLSNPSPYHYLPAYLPT